MDLDENHRICRASDDLHLFFFQENQTRLIEQKALHSLADKKNMVLTCGGGAPCFSIMPEWMKSLGTMIFLYCDVEELVARLKTEQEHRPLIQDLDEKVGTYFMQEIRWTHTRYQKADTHLPCG